MKFSEFIQPFLKERPKPERNLDQFYATFSTVEKRVEYLKNLPDFKNRSLLFLGDDDLASLAVSYYFPDKEITVVDIDERILQFIKKVSQKWGGKIKIYQHDLRNPLPKAEFKNFEIIFLIRLILLWLLKLGFKEGLRLVWDQEVILREKNRRVWKGLIL